MESADTEKKTADTLHIRDYITNNASGNVEILKTW